MVVHSCTWRVQAALLISSAAILLTGCGTSSPSTSPGSVDNSGNTVTPIKHVVIVIGENRSFDNLFATYQPPVSSSNQQTIFNMLSEGIVNVDGSPGPNFTRAVQQQATDTPADAFQISPTKTAAYTSLPQPNCGFNMLTKTFSGTYGLSTEPGLATSDQGLMNTGGYSACFIGFKDDRFDQVPGKVPIPYDATSYPGVTTQDTLGDPVHRFYQMWQQSDCNTANATSDNPSGCLHDLYPWVGVTVGWAVGTPINPADWFDELTFQGAVSMPYYNMANGDLQGFKQLADTYAISDNYHQFIMGGTGPNSISIGTAAPLVYSDANGKPAVPPVVSSTGKNQIEDPNADDTYSNNNNYYAHDGFPLYNGGNVSNAAYTNCSDSTQPGVAAIMNYLHSLPYKTFNNGNCAQGSYYLLNDDLPTYNRDGSIRADFTDYQVGPSSVPTMADALSAAHVTWHYYGEGFSTGSPVYANYCEICNPFQYATSVMTTRLKSNFKDIPDLATDLNNGTLPAVSYVKPDNITDGHPGTSTPAMYQAFVTNIVSLVQKSDAWASTAIIITTDESGGMYDSGYIQPIDFFGDGPRIPLLIVSPYAKKGTIDHTYNDHASISKFIEYNWSLKPLSSTSRDNLPNPTAGTTPYVPGNSPAIGDLTTMFDFPSSQ